MPTALVLAAHGSRRESAANALLKRHAAHLRRLGLFDEVAVAFHQHGAGECSFATVLDSLTSSEVTVVPFMTSDGYYCDTVLPRELARNRRYSQVRLRCTPPMGLAPELPSLVRERVRELVATYGLAAQRTAVAVVGHGTERHRGSRRATERLARTLDVDGPFCRVLPFFLDEAPGIEEIPVCLEAANLIVVPFLIGGSAHLGRDLPRRLGLTAGERLSLPWAGPLPVRSGPAGGDPAGDRFLVLDDAVGAHPALVRVVAALSVKAGLAP